MGESGEKWRKMIIFANEFEFNNVRMRFLGNIEAKTDAKGRVFLPAAFRKVLQASGQEALVMRKDVFQNCLKLYPESVAERIELDGNGRFLIGKRYLQLAGIDRDVKFLGMDDTIEIWAAEKAEKPFMEAELFGEALEDVMKDVKNED